MRPLLFGSLALGALLASAPAAAQDSARLRLPTAPIGQVVPSEQLRPQVQIRRVDPGVLLRMARDTAASTAPGRVGDTATYVASLPENRALQALADPALQAGRLSYVLPYRVLAPAAAAGEEGGARSYLRPVVQVGGEGLSFAGSAEGFRGTVYVGVQDSLQPAASRSLPQPIHFLVDAVGGSVEPASIAVEHTNLPFRELTVLTREPRDSVELRVRSSVHGEPLPLTVPVSRPSLSVRANPEPVAGLGLETTTLTVQADRVPGGEVRVTLEATMGRPEPSEVTLGPDGTGQATLRSTGLGVTEVRATGAGLRPASARVRFGFPLAFLLAALLGGVAGGTARHFRSDGGEGEASWAREAAAGVVFGLIVAVAYAVGVNLLGVELGAQYGEALVFTLAALGGYARIPTGRAAPAAGG